MHKFASIALLLVAPTPSLAPSTVRGTVSERRGACSYFAVETQRGSDVRDWRQGYEPDLDDVIAGNFESYGFHDVVDVPQILVCPPGPAPPTNWMVVPW